MQLQEVAYVCIFVEVFGPMLNTPELRGMRVLYALVAVFGVSLIAGEARSEELSAQGIVKSLTSPGSSTRVTRGLPTSKASPDERTYLKQLPARGLRIETKKELGAIIDRNRFPNLDIEIRFDYDSTRIQPTSVADLNMLGVAMLDPSLKGTRLLVSGHTDSKGDNQYNMDLSEGRANAVRDYLIRHFPIGADRLMAVGFGEERLKNLSEPQGAENRRVEVINLSTQ